MMSDTRVAFVAHRAMSSDQCLMNDISAHIAIALDTSVRPRIYSAQREALNSL